MAHDLYHVHIISYRYRFDWWVIQPGRGKTQGGSVQLSEAPLFEGETDHGDLTGFWWKTLKKKKNWFKNNKKLKNVNIDSKQWSWKILILIQNNEVEKCWNN